MSNKKTLAQMSESEAALAGISSLADRPNDASRYGDGGLTAKALKERFDALPNLVRQKFNEIATMLTAADAAKYITIGAEDNALGETLYDFLLLFGSRGDGAQDKNISDYIETLYDVPLEDADGNKNYSRTLKDIVQSVVDRIAAINAAHTALASLVSSAEISSESDNSFKITFKGATPEGEEQTIELKGLGPVDAAGIKDGAVSWKKLHSDVHRVFDEHSDSVSVALTALYEKIQELEKVAITSVLYDGDTGVMTFNAKKDTEKVIDLPIERLLSDKSYFDNTPGAEAAVLVLRNDDEIRIPIDSMTSKVVEYINGIHEQMFDLQEAPPISALADSLLLTTPTLAHLATLS